MTTELRNGMELQDWNYIPPDDKALPDPTFARYLLMPVQPPNVTKGGIIRPDQNIEGAEHHVYVARVIKRGPGVGEHPRYREQMKLGPHDYARVGDYVLFPKFQVMRFKVGGVSFVIINEDEVRGILRKENVTAETLGAFSLL